MTVCIDRSEILMENNICIYNIIYIGFVSIIYFKTKLKWGRDHQIKRNYYTKVYQGILVYIYNIIILVHSLIYNIYFTIIRNSEYNLINVYTYTPHKL